MSYYRGGIDQAEDLRRVERERRDIEESRALTQYVITIVILTILTFGGAALYAKYGIEKDFDCKRRDGCYEG